MTLEICYSNVMRGHKKNKCHRLGTPRPVCPICGREYFASCCEYAQECVKGGRLGTFPRTIQKTVTEIFTPNVKAYIKDKRYSYDL